MACRQFDKAADANMPKDNVQRAITRGTGGDEGTNYEEVRYEGYGIGGAAVMVDCMTDRTALEAELEQILRQGYATDAEEFVDGLVCVAVPVLGSGRAAPLLAVPLGRRGQRDEGADDGDGKRNGYIRRIVAGDHAGIHG